LPLSGDRTGASSPHGVGAAAWTSVVVGDTEPEAPRGARDPRRRGERAPGVGPRRGALVPTAPAPPPPPPLRHVPMWRPPSGGHRAGDAAARLQGRPPPAQRVGAAAAGHLHLEAQEAGPGARCAAAGPPGPGNPVSPVLLETIASSAESNTGAAWLLGSGMDADVGGDAAVRSRRRRHRCRPRRGVGYRRGVPRQGKPPYPGSSVLDSPVRAWSSSEFEIGWACTGCFLQDDLGNRRGGCDSKPIARWATFLELMEHPPLHWNYNYNYKWLLGAPKRGLEWIFSK
jgi:hypothetical protein